MYVVKLTRNLFASRDTAFTFNFERNILHALCNIVLDVKGIL